MRKKSDTSFRIRIQSGRRPLAELIDELARQAVRKHMDACRASGHRVKKMTAAGRAA
ncbi:hypothetical protein ACFQI7_37335 [Paenibacillus allorhizosphaerae]|uniref:Uncharacterized protein n=1 Tax=Paenibacillus allorhizosphaerae TaxID=2849866 RepID=A0ABM8VKZ8_9BACL|nr:hypothetical protein [Paenibacillus allorhizosphaerae]CAG7647850.1 hypothetical protein PAECIP111802_04079 [Paenibacillus allorhizosphaerae]